MNAPAKRLRVFLAGEGANDLGGWAAHRSYRRPERPGVLEALIRKVTDSGWVICEAKTWASVKKLRVGRDHADIHNVLALALDAYEAECHVLVFSRDQDNDQYRAEAIADGIALAEARYGNSVSIVGGLAVRKLEAWILALKGERRSEEPACPEDRLAKLGVPRKDTRAMVECVESADLASLPEDAKSLRAWIALAQRRFC